MFNKIKSFFKKHEEELPIVVIENQYCDNCSKTDKYDFEQDRQIRELRTFIMGQKIIIEELIRKIEDIEKNIKKDK